MGGTPDVLASPPTSPGRRWLTLGLVLIVAAVAVVVALVGGGGGDQPAQSAAATAATTPAPTGRPRPTAPTIAPADRITGTLPPLGGLPNGSSAAVAAARTVADSYCNVISSWQLTIDGEDGEYFNVVVLLRPAGSTYRDVALRIELTWDTDHYTWAGSRSALEACP